ncbi:MAG: hypothetical protein FJ303_21755 [Planctomycetes bacterium]|nr:hypothetical protein [Planctomycetota bacterium]
MPVIIEGYLTQQKLAVALVQIFGERWVGAELRHPKSRRRWDMAIHGAIGYQVVEYDGDEHYCNSLKIKADMEKDRLASESGWRVVRIPYWVQLDSVMLDHYFQVQAAIEQNFPHGFITTKFFPASFCEKGIHRFESELASLPESVRQAVIASLRDRAGEHGVDYVVPSALRHLVS